MRRFHVLMLARALCLGKSCVLNVGGITGVGQWRGGWDSFYVWREDLSVIYSD